MSFLVDSSRHFGQTRSNLYRRIYCSSKTGTCSDFIGFNQKLKVRFGEPKNAIAQLIERGFLPESFRNFQQVYKATWDIETFERKHERDNESECVETATVTDAILRPVSIGVSSNMPGFENRFFCRQSSSLEDGDEMVHEFMDYLFKMAEKLQTLIPKEITEAAEKLTTELEGQGFSKTACEDRDMLHHLNNYKKLSVYGFNSGKLIL